MATSPTAKEVSVDLAGFKSSVDQQFKAVDKQLDLAVKLIFAMFAIFPIIIGGGFLLRSDLGEVKVELGKIGVQVSALREDVNRIAKRAENAAQISDPQVLALQTQMNSALRRIEDKLNVSPSTPLALTDDEKSLIRLYFNLNKGGPSKEPAKYAVGDLFTGAKELPTDLISKLSRLKGLRVGFDPSDGSALLVAADDRIVAIVEQA
jgi:hypothetical protein